MERKIRQTRALLGKEVHQEEDQHAGRVRADRPPPRRFVGGLPGHQNATRSRRDRVEFEGLT